MRRLLTLIPLLLFAGLVAYFAAGLQRDPQILPSVLIDKPVPQFALPPVPGLDSPGFASADLRGRVVLVNFFASWCAPCRLEHPLLMKLAREDKLTILAVNYKDKADAAKAALERDGNPYQAVGFDHDGRVAIDWGVYGAPETFVVDREGRVRYRLAAPLTPQLVQDQILPLVRSLTP